jgi:hypothetical protein
MNPLVQRPQIEFLSRSVMITELWLDGYCTGRTEVLGCMYNLLPIFNHKNHMECQGMNWRFAAKNQ